MHGVIQGLLILPKALYDWLIELSSMLEGRRVPKYLCQALRVLQFG